MTEFRKKVRKDLYGDPCVNPCGYCMKHKCMLTVKQLKMKKCLQKGCHHLVRYNSHPYWHRREEVKEARNERKKERKAYVDKHTYHTAMH